MLRKSILKALLLAKSISRNATPGIHPSAAITVSIFVHTYPTQLNTNHRSSFHTNLPRSSSASPYTDTAAASATELAGLAVSLTDDTPKTLKKPRKGPLISYEEGKEEGLLRSDPRQEITVQKLQQVYDDLYELYPPSISRSRSGLTLVEATQSGTDDSNDRPWWSSLFNSKTNDSDDSNDGGESVVKGLYMYGGVGCGKTMLMDLFVACAPHSFKVQRTHFHDFMLDIHSSLRHHQSTSDPLSLVADDVASSTHVLCLDELFVTDVADAMILHRLFARLWEKDVVLIATSNRHPDALYENGLQRSLFLPFIDRLKKECVIHDMESTTDYRQLAHHKEGMYFIDAHTRDRDIEQRFIELTNNQPVRQESVEVAMGRTLDLPRTGGCITYFTFDELCNRPLGAADYIALANAKHTLALANIPVFTAANRASAYRFITLIDVLYEHRVRTICSAEAMPHKLFQHVMSHHDAKILEERRKRKGDGGGLYNSNDNNNNNNDNNVVVDDNLAFAKDRTVSRLTEMQSTEYLRAHAEEHAPELLYALEEAAKRERKKTW